MRLLVATAQTLVSDQADAEVAVETAAAVVFGQTHLPTFQTYPRSAAELFGMPQKDLYFAAEAVVLIARTNLLSVAGLAVLLRTG